MAGGGGVRPGAIRRLPLVRMVLIGAGGLFLLRGLFIVLTVMVVLGIRPGAVLPAAVGSHLVFLAAGIAFLGGAVLNWRALRSRQPDA